MANITLNIGGDLNIFLEGENGKPECLYLDGVDGSLDTLEILLDVDDDDTEANATVLYAFPGQELVPMTLYEALRRMLDHGGLDSAELLPAYNLLIAFNSDDIISCDGGLYLAGPGVIFSMEGGEIVTLNKEDRENARRLMKALLEKLTNGRETCFAYEM